MPLENITISRMCLHEIHKRSDDRAIVPPTLSDELLELNTRARDAFLSRVYAAFKSDSHSLPMEVRDFGPGTVAETGLSLIAASDPNFISLSKDITQLLAIAQASRKIPGGMVVVFDGLVGHPPVPFFAVMKAELQEGFLKKADLKAEFVDNLFLSPRSKLYKIGIFTSSTTAAPSTGADWLPIVFDSQITSLQREGATYFHDTFLGLKMPENAAQETRRFVEQTREFIKKSSLSEEDKVDIYNGLYTYIKVEQSPFLSVFEFGERFLPGEMHDGYLQSMRAAGIATTAIRKDTTEISGLLRQRKLRFPRSITLSGPSDAMADLVEVERIKHDGHGEVWTQITVKAELRSQE